MADVRLTITADVIRTYGSANRQLAIRTYALWLYTADGDT